MAEMLATSQLKQGIMLPSYLIRPSCLSLTSTQESLTPELIAITGRTRAVEVDQSIGYYGKSNFKITATLYEPDTYIDYTKALHNAAKSCPIPQ